MEVEMINITVAWCKDSSFTCDTCMYEKHQKLWQLVQVGLAACPEIFPIITTNEVPSSPLLNKQTMKGEQVGHNINLVEVISANSTDVTGKFQFHGYWMRSHGIVLLCITLTIFKPPPHCGILCSCKKLFDGKINCLCSFCWCKNCWMEIEFVKSTIIIMVQHSYYHAIFHSSPLPLKSSDNF